MADVSIPRFVTPRLVLRAPVAEDFPAYAALMASPRARLMAARSTCAPPAGSSATTWRKGRGSGTARWACVEQLGFDHGQMFPEREQGRLAHGGHEIQSYAAEAPRALRDRVAAACGMRGLASCTDPANDRSVAVTKRLGSGQDNYAPRRDPDDLVFRHP